MDSFDNALNTFISTVLRFFNRRSSHSSALTFANVSIDIELIVQYDISRYDRECELMNGPSVGI